VTLVDLGPARARLRALDPYRMNGRVSELIGLVVESRGPEASVGERCEIHVPGTRTGTPPLFCPEALVVSAFPVNATGSASQRARWEHGHLATILGEAPGLFLYAIRLRRADAFALALDLCVPPLALLALIIAVLHVRGRPLGSRRRLHVGRQPRGGGRGARRNFLAKALDLVLNMDAMIGGDFDTGLAAVKSVAKAASRG